MRDRDDDDWLETTELDGSELCAIATSVIVAGEFKGERERNSLWH